MKNGVKYSSRYYSPRSTSADCVSVGLKDRGRGWQEVQGVGGRPLLSSVASGQHDRDLLQIFMIRWEIKMCFPNLSCLASVQEGEARKWGLGSRETERGEGQRGDGVG